jgi:hypothetical protein
MTTTKHRQLRFAVLAALAAGGASASSHREAPFISTRPSVDGTDFYLFNRPRARYRAIDLMRRERFAPVLLADPSERRAVDTEAGSESEGSPVWLLSAELMERCLALLSARILASISDQSGGEIWRLEVFGNTDRLVAHSGKLLARPAGHDYELWALPKGAAPVSLGILPGEGASSRTLNRVQWQALANSSQVAVSIEPRGGSPTGQPTGTIVYVAPLQAAS